MKCHCCGYEFPPSEEVKITAQAADTPIISTEAATWRAVTRRRFFYHEGKAGKTDSVKVSYFQGLTQINDWLCPEHSGYAKSKADRYWAKHGGKSPYPKTVYEWIERHAELNDTAEIEVQPDGKYWRVKDYRVGTVAANDNKQPAANDNRWELDDAIPF